MRRKGARASRPQATLGRTIWRLLGKALLLLLLLFLLMQLWYLGHVLWWKSFDPSSTAFMEAGLARLQVKNPDAELRYRWVDYPRISMNLKRAVVAAEDSKFLAHDGFDWECASTNWQVIVGASPIQERSSEPS